MFFGTTMSAVRSGPGRMLAAAGRKTSAGCRFLLWLATFLAATAWTSLGWAADPLSVDLFFDMAGDDLAEASASWGEGASGPSEIVIGGVPLRIGEGAADGGWRTMAGANGRYTLSASGSFTAIARTKVTRTDFVEAGVADRSVALAATEFRYVRDRWTLGLQPSLEVTRWDSDVMQHDSGAEARIVRALGGGLSLATSGRYRWRTVIGGEAADREIAASRTGIVYNLPQHLRADLAYVVRHEVAKADSARLRPHVVHSAGPSVALALPLDDSFDLSANYDFTQTTRDQHADAGRDRHGEDLHQLGLAGSWDLGGDAADIELSAAYNYGHFDAAGSAGDDTRHAGTVSFALNF